MNERFKQLAIEAKLIAPEYNGFDHTRLSISQQRFAELIVGQMLAITDAHTEVFQTDRDKALIEHIKQSVKTHFGVEE